MDWQFIRGVLEPVFVCFYFGVAGGLAGLPFEIFFQMVKVNLPLPIYVAGVFAGLLGGAIGIGVSRAIVTATDQHMRQSQ